MRGKILLLMLLIAGIFINPVFAETKFEVDISKGLIPGHIAVFDVGHNEDVGTSEEDIWGGPTTSIPWLTSATRLNVTSSDVDDTLLGTGARMIQIEGLDANYNRINETLAMNGQNNATTVNAYLRINVASITISGTDGGNNEGDIYIGEGPIIAGVQAISYDFIDSGYGRSMVSAWTIPANYTLYLTSTLYTTHTGSTGKSVETYLNVRILGPTGNRTRWRVFEVHSSTSEFDRPFGPPAAIPGPTDLFFSAEVDVGSGAVSTDFTGFIVRDGFEVVTDNVASTNNGLLYLLIAIIIVLSIAWGFKK